VRGNPEQLARARDLLLQLERLWVARFSQLDAVLADPRPLQESPCPSRPSSPTRRRSRSP
jgi:hypothetical protein